MDPFLMLIAWDTGSFLWNKNAQNDTDIGSKSQMGNIWVRAELQIPFWVTTGTHQSLPGTSSRLSVATERVMPCTEH